MLGPFRGALAGETAVTPRGQDGVAGRIEELKLTERDLLKGFCGLLHLVEGLGEWLPIDDGMRNWCRLSIDGMGSMIL